MNKILVILCGVGLVLVACIVAYINYTSDGGLEKGHSSDEPNAAQPKTEPARDKTGKVLVRNLDTPCGLAIQPDTGHVFVSTRNGIIRVVPGDNTGVFDEVVGFPNDSYGRGPIYHFGPLGLAFAERNLLVCGCGGQPDGKDIVRLYTVHDEPLPKDKVRKASEMVRFTTSIPPSEETIQGEGNFFGIAVLGSSMFVTCNGDDTKGWISKADLQPANRNPIPLRLFIPSKIHTNADAPTGIAISPDGKLVVSHAGNVNVRKDSLLAFYDPKTGSLQKKLKADLRDLIAIAYSPKTGDLYGLDFAWANPAEGGLFRLDVEGDKVKATKVASLNKPTAMAFAPDGTLYVVVIGVGDENKSGQVVVFPDLN